MFVYPEAKLVPTELMRVRGGKVLKQLGRTGDRLLARLDKLYQLGPKHLPREELAARKVWLRKMAERASVKDIEGNFRRAWLLTALLEDYFVFRNRWYEGPKLGLIWLRENKPHDYLLFQKALKPSSHLADIRQLIQRVIS